MIKILIAGLCIGIDNRFDHIEHLAADYLTDADAEFTVSATDEELRREAEMTPDIRFTDGYLESIVVYRKIAERLPQYDAFVFHGAVLNVDGCAYAFTAKSGVGKTTHTRLWHSYLGDKVHCLNGDKPIIRFFDGVPYACGTPWRGKENFGINERAPLRAIGFIKRAEHNTARPLDPRDVDTAIMKQIYLPRSAASAVKTLRLANRLIGSVRLVEINCNMDVEAAEVAFAAMTRARATEDDR